MKTTAELRDELAGLAMQGMLAACQGHNGNAPNVDRLTRTAYKYANAMLQAREMTPHELEQWGQMNKPAQGE